MDSLSVKALSSYLNILLKNDDNVRRTMATVVLSHDWLDETMKNFESLSKLGNLIFDHVDNNIKNIGISSIHTYWRLIDLLNNQHMINFIRVMQIMKALPQSLPIDENRVASYLKELTFSDDYGIDLVDMSKKIQKKFDVKRIHLLGNLSQKQRNVIETLTSKQMTVLAHFNHNGIRILRKVMRLNPIEISTLLSLKEADYNVIRELGEENSQLFSSFHEHEIDSIFNTNTDDSKDIRLQNAIEDLKMKKLNGFHTNPMNIEGTIGNLAIEIAKLSRHEINAFLKFNFATTFALTTLNNEQWNGLETFDDHDISLQRVLQIAESLPKNELDVILSLQKEEFDMIFETFSGDDMSTILNLSPEGRAHMSEMHNLDPMEQQFLLRLNPTQRRVLAKFYNLRRDGIDMIIQLTPDQVLECFNSRSQNLNVMQQVLRKRINDLDPQQRNKITRLTENDLNEFFQIKNLSSESRGVLFALSKEGIAVLRAMAKLKKPELDLVYHLTEGKMIVLAHNSNLDSEGISLLGYFTRAEQKVLINLNYQQRNYLENHINDDIVGTTLFTPHDLYLLRALKLEHEQLFHRIVGLSDEEKYRLTALNEFEHGLIHNLQPEEHDLFATLRQEQISGLANVLNWRLEEELVFDLWSISTLNDDTKHSVRQVISNLNGRINGFSNFAKTQYMKLVAAAVVSTKLSLVDKLTLVDTVAAAIEEPSLKLAFHFNVLNYSVQPGSDDRYLNQLFDKIDPNREDFGTLFDFNDNEDLKFLIWLMPREKAQRITRSALMSHSSELQKLIDRMPRDKYLPPLRQQLRGEQYLLAHRLFFDDSSRILKNIFDANDCFRFLNSPVRETVDPFSQGYNVLEYSMFYNRGDPMDFLERVKSEGIRELFNRKPAFLLSVMAKNGRTDLLNVFKKSVGVGPMKDVLNFNRPVIFQDLVDNLESSERLRNKADTIRWFMDIDQEHAELYKVEVIPKLVASVQQRVASRDWNLVLDSLNPEFMDIEMPMGASCSNQRVRRYLTRCVDSWEPEEITKEEKEQRFKQIFHDNVQKPSVNLAGKIGNTAEATGLAFTVFLVTKHIAHGDIDGLSGDGLNLWVMPKIGQKISQLVSRVNKVIAPILGRAVGNFAAFLGLANSIKARIDAKDVWDSRIADLNIVSNSIFITADIPAVGAEIMEAAGMEIGMAAELAGPIGLAVSVSVIVLTELVEVGLQVEKLASQIELTTKEKLNLYWDFLWDNEIPNYIEYDITLEKIYEDHISKIVNEFQNKYDQIGVTLPAISITKRPLVMDFNMTAIIRNVKHPRHYSRLIPKSINKFNLTCGPSCDNVIASGDKLFIPHMSGDDCENVVLYRNHTKQAENSLFYAFNDISLESSQIGSLDMIVRGNRVFVKHDNKYPLNKRIQNRFYFMNQANHCVIHKKGLNLLFINSDNFYCNLGHENQRNVAVIHGKFLDFANLHSIVGSTGKNTIQVSHASVLDGRGGNDHIVSMKPSTIVKGHFGDTVQGKATIMLPSNVNEIARILMDRYTYIYNDNGEFIKVDRKCLLKTSDDFFITPTRFLKKTQLVTDVHLHKNNNGDITLEEELTNLRNIQNSNFRMTKQVTSVNYSIVISNDKNNNVFHSDKNFHNFYWEGARNNSNLYLFDKINARVTISQGKGLLDFSRLNSTLENTHVFFNTNVGQVSVKNEDLSVTLLEGHNDIKMTFDGEIYYKISHDQVQRDYCSHALNVVEKMKINAIDLLNHYNCLEFHSNKLLFMKIEDDLLLVAVEQMLLLQNYYLFSSDVSVKLNDVIMRPEDFQARANEPSSFKYYSTENEDFILCHNQPIDENQIGFLDLKNNSILDYDMNIIGTNLSVSYKNSTVVTVVHWSLYQFVREMIFAFNDTLLTNTQCTLSNCKPTDILQEFQIEKQTVENRLTHDDIVRSQSRPKRHQPKMVDNNDHFHYPTRTAVDNVKFPALKEPSAEGGTSNWLDHGVWMNNNLSLALLLIQSFLNKKCPLPETTPTSEENVSGDAYCIVEEFENLLKVTADQSRTSIGDIDFFQVYTSVKRLMTNGEYSRIPEVLYLTVEGACVGDEEFLGRMKVNIENTLRKL